MKILAIRLKNLTSIEGMVEVDFTAEPLRSAGIFAISGATGAGKSTLLDALCLALYDKAPRFEASAESISLADVGENQISQSDVRNLLRRGMSEGYAEVDFLAVDGDRYRSRWSVRRTRSKADGSLRSQVIEVRNMDTDDELQGTKKELLVQLAELVGLTYEQFTRTVLLAQNDFATFLKSKGAAKAELLEKLTGTDIYSRISQEVFARNKAAQEEANVTRGQLEIIQLIPEEEYQALLQEQKVRNEKRVQDVRLLAQLNEQWNVVRSLKTQEEFFKKKQTEEVVEREKKRVLAETLATQEEGFLQFKAQWEAIQPDLKKARQLDVQIRAQSENCTRTEQILQAVRKQASEQEQKFQAESVARQKIYQVLNGLLGLPDTEEAFQIDAIETTLRADEQQLTEQQKTNEECLSQLKAFDYPTLTEQQAAGQKELLRLQNVRELAANRERTNLEIQRLLKEAEILEKEFAVREAELRAIQRLYDNARMAIGKDVKALRQQLHEGEACPVCGSKTHPYHHSEQIADTLFQEMEQAYQTASAAYQQVNNRLISIARDLSHHQELAQQVTIQLAALQKGTLEEVDEATVKARLEKIILKMEEYQRLNTVWQQQEENIKKLRTRCETLRERVTECQLSTQKVQSAGEQLNLLRSNEQAEQIRYQTLSAELAELHKDRSALLKGKDADEAEAVVAKREKELLAALEQSRKEVETIQTRISGLQGEMKQLSATLQELAKQKEAIENPEQLPETIGKQQETNRESERQLAIIDARILQQEKNKAMRLQVVRELEEKQSIAERWAKLNKLIGSADGTKFKVIAQSYTLNLLLFHTNRHLSYLSKRYRLQQVPDTLALQVIDGEMCDEVRTVYSLSGGESFLISLALALGLSSLSSNNLKVESLFIDEGFGALDADSLRTAMEALEQLQIQGRKIGVISHVQEMSERISVQVKISKKVNGKSSLSVVG